MVAVVFVLAFDQWLVFVGQVEQGLEEHQAEVVTDRSRRCDTPPGLPGMG
jgi:hypothetical protein